jgi:methylthioribulose-1-phosphate dehydratase
VAQFRRNRGFAHELAHELRIALVLAVDALQAHALLEAARAATQRQVSLGHATLAEARLDLVRPDAYGHDCHGISRPGPALRLARTLPRHVPIGQSGPLDAAQPACYTGAMSTNDTPQRVIVELCRQFYGMGWCTGTGGGISLRQDGRIYMAPSGVQKERIAEDDIFVLDEQGQVIDAPLGKLKLTECAPLFMNAYRLRGAGAVIHSHGVYALLATLLGEAGSAETSDTFECTEIEMIKGIAGHGYYDRLLVPIIENTARECDLADRMAAAIEAYPQSTAVLVRRHGVYIWGRDWQHAKSQAECYHYLFEAAVRMAQLGLDARKSSQQDAGRIARVGGVK